MTRLKMLLWYGRCLCVVAALIPLSASAIDRLNGQDQSCAQVNERIDAKGAIIVRYPSSRSPGLTLYDRYVADIGFCAFDEGRETKMVSTRDGLCELSACRHRFNTNDR